MGRHGSQDEDAGDSLENAQAVAVLNSDTGSQRSTKNAFQELMTRKRKPESDEPRQQAKSTPAVHAAITSFHGRDALGAYITAPASFPSSQVISYDDDFVLIHDLFPKSEVHLLLLPRDLTKTLLHPFEALADEAFRDKVLASVEAAKNMIAAELRRLHGLVSESEKARNEAMQRGDAELPKGRDWLLDVAAGVHAVPSMSHLHIHVLSVDRYSEALKHRKHYNSFATPFFVPIGDVPLAADDERRHPTPAGYLARDLVCWRCGRNFGNRFARLKDHLEEERHEWRRI